MLREVRDLPILDVETWLALPLVRLRCSRCGPTVEAVPWLDRYQRMTTRLAESVVRLAEVLAVKQVAGHFGVSWDTVKTIDRAALERRLGPVDLAGGGGRRAAAKQLRVRRVKGRGLRVPPGASPPAFGTGGAGSHGQTGLCSHTHVAGSGPRFSLSDVPGSRCRGCHESAAQSAGGSDLHAMVLAAGHVPDSQSTGSGF